jgi:predicted nucleotidyltransferase component of viral defense system
MGDSMSAFASDLPDFGDLIKVVASTKNVPPAVIEKDYYVVRALRALCDSIPNQFVFKGGTSLSKGWNLLERFSEDVDLLFRIEEDGQQLSKGELDRRMKNAQAVVQATPGFALGDIFSDRGVHRTCKLSYKQIFDPVSALGDTVVLEMGTRGGTNPSTFRTVQSFLTEHTLEHGPHELAEDLTSFEVECLDITRTFVEKLFAIHAAYEKNRADGKVRHYYDVYQMADTDEIKAFIGTQEYRDVYNDSEKYSYENWPEAALPVGRSFADSPALQPDEEGLRSLENNYAKEAGLFFVEPPALGDILARFQKLLPKL